jgi:hypothetical protein
MGNERIVRTFKSEIRAVEGGILEGLAIPFNVVADIGGYFREVIDQKAFEECDLTDVALFVNHDDRKIPLARSRRNNGNSTMQLTIDQIFGLRIKAMLDIEKNLESKALFSAVQREDLDGMSFKFLVKREEWSEMESDTPLRRIMSFEKIMEVSAVTYPAYEATELTARDKEALDNARMTLEKARTLEKVTPAKINKVVFDRVRFEINLLGGK